MQNIAKKILLILIVFQTILFSDQNFGAFSNASSEQTVTQKKLNTKKDLDNLINTLKEAISYGDADSKAYLGALYYNGVTLNDGYTLKPNKKKAKMLLENAAKDGSRKALSFLYLKYLNVKDLKELTNITKIVQQSKNIPFVDKDYYTEMLAALILDLKSKNSNALEVSMKWLYSAEKKRPTPKLQFLLANMYANIGNSNAANYYLNKSCSSPSMAKICSEYGMGERK